MFVVVVAVAQEDQDAAAASAFRSTGPAAAAAAAAVAGPGFEHAAADEREAAAGRHVADGFLEQFAGGRRLLGSVGGGKGGMEAFFALVVYSGGHCLDVFDGF